MTAKDRSKPKQVTGRLKIALDLMIWEGKPYDKAAKAVGLAARSMRKALERPHVLAYLGSGKRQLRASEGPRTLRRLVTLAHQDRNANAAVAACRAIEHIPEEEAPRHGQAQVAGFVIVLREQPPAALPSGSPVVIEAAPEPRHVAPPVRQIASDGDR